MSSKLPSVLLPYTKKKDYGTLYEIAAAMSMLRAMGMTNAELDEHAALLESIAVYDSKNTEVIRDIYARTRESPVGTGIKLKGGKLVVDIICVTEDNGDARIGDFLLLTSTGPKAMHRDHILVRVWSGPR